MSSGHGEFRKQIGDGEAAADQRQKDDGEEETSGVRDSAEESGREKSHQEPGRGENGEEVEGACGKDSHGVANGEANPHGEGILRADDGDRE